NMQRIIMGGNISTRMKHLIYLLLVIIYLSTVTACGDQFNNDTGSIRYPGTNREYPHNAECSWIIVSSGDIIELPFTSFSTENDVDFVFIRDGESSSSRLLGTYSGATLPSIVRTTTNKAFIHFTSDHSVTNTGFALRWNTVGILNQQIECRNGNKVAIPYLCDGYIDCEDGTDENCDGNQWIDQFDGTNSGL
ncbi:unnamed protein product, partial [Meganyctiphanes norvegica]